MSHMCYLAKFCGSIGLTVWA